MHLYTYSHPNATSKISGPQPFQRQSPLVMANITPGKKKKLSLYILYLVFDKMYWRIPLNNSVAISLLVLPPDLKSTN